MAFFDLGNVKIKDDIKDSYDVIIIGGGPGGLTAGIYAAQAGLDSLIIEYALEGGNINNTEVVENWTGTESISGMKLSEKMTSHAKTFGVSFANGRVVDLELEGDNKVVFLEDGKKIRSKVVIISTGSDARKLGIQGEKELTGKGISYCAICDGHFFKDKHVAIIGGGKSALNEALFLCKIVKKITVIERGYTPNKILINKVKATGKVDFIFDTIVEKIEGENKVESLKLFNKKTEKGSTLEIDGVFVFIGSIPNTTFLKEKIKLNDSGYIIGNDNMETNIPGVYAVGDVREKEFRQIVTAAADGAIAASHAARTYFNI